MLASQGGCAICKTFTLVKGQKFMHVDHAERNGEILIRGILCKDCNTGIGMFKGVPDFLQRAAYYVEVNEEKFSV